jgi:hypothetical protein
MIWFDATFKVASHGGNLDAKPKFYRDLLVQALAVAIGSEIFCGEERADLIKMIRSITVRPSTPENVASRPEEVRGPGWLCTGCAWVNNDLRTKCRHCGERKEAVDG